jgi:hypothetical protein
MKVSWFEFLARGYRATHPLPLYDERHIADLEEGEPLDVFIPLIEKDIPLLHHCIPALHAFLHHPIGEICIISPKNAQLVSVAKDLGIVFIDENELLPDLRRDDVQFYTKSGENRRGWIIQQLLKLAADELTSKKHYFVIDADTILTRKQNFTPNGKTVFLQNDAIREEYFYVNKRVFGFATQNYWSFVSHQMLFKTDWLADMKRHIENRKSEKWYHALIHNLERTKGVGMSEYELYGNWCLNQYPDEVLCVDWENFKSKRGYIEDSIQNEGDYRSVSRHSYFAPAFVENNQ